MVADALSHAHQYNIMHVKAADIHFELFSLITADILAMRLISYFTRR